MRSFSVTIFFVLFFSLAVIASPQEQSQFKPDSAITLAKLFIGLLDNAEYATATGMFDSTMKAVMPEAKLKGAWEGVITQTGPVAEIADVKTQKIGIYQVAFAMCKTPKTEFVTRVVFDPAARIAGLFFVPPVPEYVAPSYVKRDAFHEQDVTVGSGQWALNGTLSVPNGDGPFPAIVLVHGSGPNDRDETIGPNKPFRDLAWGLASQGIAVLRYEKRTKQHAAELFDIRLSITVKDETIDDALAAVALLRHMASIDSNRIFVLGHSLGGMLVPRIGRRDPRIAGFVVLAGLARPLEDAMLEQTDYIAGLSSPLTANQRTQLDLFHQQVAMIKNLKPSDTASSKSFLGMGAAYLLDLRGYNPPKVAQGVKQPMLFLQGGRDYQVTETDFNAWKKGLQGKKNVTFKWYPSLNHLFMEGEGKSKPAEYEKVGHVPEYVVGDIGVWMKK